jgi:lia operon protein LiaH
MNLLTRIKNAVLADLNEVLDKKEQKNPIALLNQYLRESELETEKVRKLLERQYLLKEQFLREYQHANEMAEKRNRQAEIAFEAGETELHQFALNEKIQYEQRASRLKEALETTEKQLGELEQKYEEMKHKLKDMHIRRLEIMGRENLSRTYSSMNKVLNDHTYSNHSFSRFEEIEAYLDRLEQQVNRNYYRNTIEARIAELEKQAKNEKNVSL